MTPMAPMIFRLYSSETTRNRSASALLCALFLRLPTGPGADERIRRSDLLANCAVRQLPPMPLLGAASPPRRPLVRRGQCGDLLNCASFPVEQFIAAAMRPDTRSAAEISAASTLWIYPSVTLAPACPKRALIVGTVNPISSAVDAKACRSPCGVTPGSRSPTMRPHAFGRPLKGRSSEGPLVAPALSSGGA
jgi:hypothetical protein